MRRSQRGNNNAYCQDNETSWLDWALLERHRDLHRFVKALIAFRMRRDVVVDRVQLSLNRLLREAHIEWHGVALGCPDWSERSHSLALSVTTLRGRFRLHGMLNAYWEALRFELPELGEGNAGAWRRWIDTSLASPEDVVDWEKAPAVAGASYLVQPRSLAVLVVPLAARDAAPTEAS
jgi:glycogen operon protein